MAKALKLTETVEKPVTIIETTTQEIVELTLTPAEAEFLGYLLMRVGGDPLRSARFFAKEILGSLREAGAMESDFDTLKTKAGWDVSGLSDWIFFANAPASKELYRG